MNLGCRRISIDFDGESSTNVYLIRKAYSQITSVLVKQKCPESAMFSEDDDVDSLFSGCEVMQTLHEAIEVVKSLSTECDIPSSNFSFSPSLISTEFTTRQLLAHIISLRAEYVQRLARPIIQKFYLHPKNAKIFNYPVDPVALNIPGYLEKIKMPMDLGTIRNRLHAGEYHSLQSCFRDVRLVFKNAIQFNGEGHLITKIAQGLLEEFEGELRLLKEKCSREYHKRNQHKCELCPKNPCVLCGEKCLKFETPILFCSGSNCGQKIRRNTAYFISSDGTFVYCQKCYSSLPAVFIDHHASTDCSRSLTKKQLLKRKFDEEITEPWISCLNCGLSFHRICALVPDLSSSERIKSFICPICAFESALGVETGESDHSMSSTAQHIKKEVLLVESDDSDERIDDRTMPLADGFSNKTFFSSALKATSLPSNLLSDFLECLVKDLLDRKGFSDVKDTITIRVTSSIFKNMEVPRALSDNFKSVTGDRLSDLLQYRQKCIQLFQNIDGVDVSLFCLYVHEFDASAPAPNTSTVYIAYLDSVDYFRPIQARSLVYQEIVTGYLLWSQYRGFKKCMIWSCPPQRGDSFIFWCHPCHQKTPSRDRLNTWYGTIFARSKSLGIHYGVQHLWERFFKKYSHRDDAPTREAAKRSFVGSGKVAAKKFRKNCDGASLPVDDDDSRSTRTSVSSIVPEQSFGIPPIFDGDYWVMEYLKLHRLYYSKARMYGEHNITSNVRKCRDVLKSLVSRPHSVAFRQPVDPVALNIPTYPLIVQKPMDLGTIREKLRACLYQNVFEFVKDVRLTFENAMLFNPPGHVVHIQAELLRSEFEKSMQQSFQDEYSNTPMDKSLDEFLSFCQLTGPASKGEINSIAPSSLSIDAADCMTPKGSDFVNVISPTNLKPLFHISPKSIIEESEEYCESKNMRLIPNIISEDLDLHIISPTSLCIPSSSSFSSTTEESCSESNNCEVTTMSVIYPDCADGSLELSSKSMSSLLGDLSKAVHRLNDDLFIIDFAPLDTTRFECSDLLSSAIVKKLNQLVPDTTDPDPLFSSPVVDSRYTFLETCQFRHFQFDSLRRAKHSSMMLLHYLQHREDKSYRPKCNCCNELIQELRWHCDVCINYDICRHCKDKLSKQRYDNDCQNHGRKAKVVEWRSEDGSDFNFRFHAHPLTPYRVSFH